MSDERFFAKVSLKSGDKRRDLTVRIFIRIDEACEDFIRPLSNSKSSFFLHKILKILRNL